MLDRPKILPGHGNAFQDPGDHVIRREAFEFRFRPQDDTMPEHRQSQSLDIVRRDVAAPFHGRKTLTGSQKRDPSSRARPKVQVWGMTALLQHVLDITDDPFLDLDFCDLLSQFRNPFPFGQPLEARLFKVMRVCRIGRIGPGFPALPAAQGSREEFS